MNKYSYVFLVVAMFAFVFNATAEDNKQYGKWKSSGGNSFQNVVVPHDGSGGGIILYWHDRNSPAAGLHGDVIQISLFADGCIKDKSFDPGHVDSSVFVNGVALESSSYCSGKSMIYNLATEVSRSKFKHILKSGGKISIGDGAPPEVVFDNSGGYFVFRDMDELESK